MIKDYKIDITKEPQAVENIITKSLQLGYQILNAAGINRKAKYIIVGNNQGVRWCDKRIFDDMHEDYINISYEEFMGLC